MIKIIDNKDCCGCNACAAICVKHCITMKSDNEGFLYPSVDTTSCSNCGLCENVCPVINQNEPHIPLTVFAAKNNNEEIRLMSSSGGVFTSIAETIIAEGGVVFGAQYDEKWNVYHSWTESIDGIKAYQGSKYVQSFIGDTYSNVKYFLNQNRKVLFSGTPCQVAGLRKYLRKEYNNLITVDIVCHGVPSPKIWKEYLQTFQITNIGLISHKDKSTGWKRYSFSIKDKKGELLYSETASKNKYFNAFLRNLILRPSCFKCPSKSGRSGSDITLADFWGIEHLHPELDDDKGTSLVCINTEKGLSTLLKLDLTLEEVQYDASIQYNPCIIKSTIEPPDRSFFWNNYQRDGIKALLSLKQNKTNIIKRIFNKLFR